MSDFGTELARLMQARGLGVRELARRVPCNPGYLSNLKNGKAKASPKLAAAVDRVLGAEGALAALAAGPSTRRPRGHVQQDDATGPEMISVPCRTPDGRIIFVTVPRRTFLQGTAAAAALGAVGAAPPAVSWARPAERFLLARRMLRDLDNLSGPRDVIPLAARQMDAMQRLRGSVRGTDLRELMLVQIQFADLLGWLHQDCGSHQAAGYWLDRALEWSHIAGDQASVAFILARKSQLAADMLDAADAVAVAEAAMRHAGGETRRWRGTGRPATASASRPGPRSTPPGAAACRGRSSWTWPISMCTMRAAWRSSATTNRQRNVSGPP